MLGIYQNKNLRNLNIYRQRKLIVLFQSRDAKFLKILKNIRMTTLRSEKMGFYNLVMPFESGWEILNELGNISCMHFVSESKDNLSQNKPFSKYLRRCEEMKFKLEAIREYMKRFGRNIVASNDVTTILLHLKQILKNRDRAERTFLEEVENEIDHKSAYISDQVKQYDELLEKEDRLIEYKAVLKKTKEILGNSIVYV